MSRLPTAARWPLRFIALLVGLCAATYVVQMSGLRYIPVTPAPAAAIAVPPSDLRAWQASRSGIAFGERDGLVAASLSPRDAALGRAGIAMLRAVFAIPDGTAALRLDARIGADALVAGDEPWQAGRVQFVSFDRDGRHVWYWPNDVYRVSGDRPFEPVSVLVPVSPSLKAAMLVIYNGAGSGVLRVGQVGVTHLAERPLFAGLRYGLVLAWVLAGLWTAWNVLNRAASVPLAALLLGTVVLALAAALTPQPGFREVTAPLQEWAASLADQVLRPAPAVAPDTPGAPAGPGEAAHGAPRAGASLVPPQTRPSHAINFKQASHLAMFFLIGLSGFLAFAPAPWLGRLACLVCLAVATECLQWFVVTRSSQVADLAADVAGLVLAGVVAPAALWVTALVRRRAGAVPGKSEPRP